MLTFVPYYMLYI